MYICIYSQTNKNHKIITYTNDYQYMSYLKQKFFPTLLIFFFFNNFSFFHYSGEKEKCKEILIFIILNCNVKDTVFSIAPI